MEYLANYRDIRASRYRADKYEKAFFLAISRGGSKRITGSAIEKWFPNTLKVSKSELLLIS